MVNSLTEFVISLNEELCRKNFKSLGCDFANDWKVGPHNIDRFTSKLKHQIVLDCDDLLRLKFTCGISYCTISSPLNPFKDRLLCSETCLQQISRIIGSQEFGTTSRFQPTLSKISIAPAFAVKDAYEHVFILLRILR